MFGFVISLDFSIMPFIGLFLCVILGVFSLALGGHLLTHGAIQVSNYFGISHLFVGLTIVSVATSLPELFTCLNAVRLSPDLALGSIIGSNIANIGLILGIISLIMPLKSNIRIVRVELRFLFLLTLIFIFFAYTSSSFNRIEGFFLIVLTIGYLFWLVRNSLTSSPSNSNEYSDLSTVKPILLCAIIWIIFGSFFLAIGADSIVGSARELSLRFSISESFIGLSIIALGTSLPELVASISASLKRKNDLCLGNIIGSNIFNLSLIGGASASFFPFVVDASFIKLEFPLLLIATTLLWLFLRKENLCIGKVQGIALLTFYIFVMVFISMK